VGGDVFDHAEAHKYDKYVKIDAKQVHELDIAADKEIAVYAHQDMT
jgi:hypothetical protein